MSAITAEFFLTTITIIVLAQFASLFLKIKPVLVGAVACAVFSLGTTVSWAQPWWLIGIGGFGLGVIGHVAFKIIHETLIIWYRSRRGY